MILDTELLDFCIEFSEKYKSLPDGYYISNDGKISVKKYKYDNIKSPTRVSRVSGKVEIQNDLDYNFSTILFMLVWAFLRLQDKSNKESDNNALELCLKTDKFIKNDLDSNVCDILNKNPTKENTERCCNLICGNN